jgi:hypothetical protein
VVPLVGRAAAVLDVYLEDARPELVHDPHEQAPLPEQAREQAPREARSGPRPQPGQGRGDHGAGEPLHAPPRLCHPPPAERRRRATRPRAPRPPSLKTTAIYTHVAPENLRRAVEKAHLYERAYNRRRKRASWPGPSK